MSQFLADPDEVAREVIISGVSPPPPPDLNRWAEENVRFGRESPMPGPYRRTSVPMMERVLDCLGPEHPARVVTVMAAAQMMKTTIGQIFIGGSMDLDPCDMLYTHPTHDNAIRWSRTKWRQMRSQSEALTRLLGSGGRGDDNNQRDRRDTLLYQERVDGLGSLIIGGANSPASLSMISVPKQVQDDLAKWVQSVEGMNAAGDPEQQADSRSAAFDWAKILKLGTPLNAQTCRLTRSYRLGTQEQWHVPCPHCQHMHPLTWTNFLSNLDTDNLDDAHFSCPSCGGIIEEKHKRAIVQSGTWVANNPGAKDVSFHTWRAYSLTRSWADIAREWVAAEGDPRREQVFWNDVLGLAYEIGADAPPWEELRDLHDKVGHTRGVVPQGGLLLVAGCDVQVDRVEVHIKAFGADLQRWTVAYDVIPHHISTEECREQLNALLEQTWPDEYGHDRPLDMLAMDGNAWTRDVFTWARHHPWTRVIIVRGANSDQAPPLALTKSERRADGSIRKTQKRFYNVGVSQMKSIFYACLKKTDKSMRGYCGCPKGMGDEFYRQMTSESRVVQKDKWGMPKAFWRLDHDRNEVLDTEMYAEAAAIRLGWYTRSEASWQELRDRWETGRRTQPSAPDTPPPPANAPPAPAPSVGVQRHAAHVGWGSPSSLADISARLNKRR